MKTIKNVLLASIMFILSANVFASNTLHGDYSVHHVTKTIKTTPVEGREAAYALALDKLNQLKSASGEELTEEFNLYSTLETAKERGTVMVDDGASITLEELMNNQGELVYRGLIRLRFSYSQAN